MGNLQTSETKQAKGKGKSKSKIKGKKGKYIEDEFVGIISENGRDTTADITLPEKEEPETRPPPPEPPDTLMVNHSWSPNEPENGEIKKPFTTPISSSDSNFTEALTPQAFSKQTPSSINNNLEPLNSAQEQFLALNSFKLNEYRARHEEEKTKKLSKLGVSKTSQISLDSDPSEWFVSDNIEIIRQVENDSGFGLDKTSDIQKSVKSERDFERDVEDGKNEDTHLTQTGRTMSNVSLANGEYNIYV